MTESVTNSLNASYSRILQIITEYSPNILAALCTALLGWVVAMLLSKLARFLASRTSSGLKRIKWLQNHSQHNPAISAIPTIIGRAVFWILFLFSLVAAVEILGLPSVSGVLGQATSYLPHVLAAILIIFFGIFIAGSARHVVERSIDKIGAAYGDALGRISQVVIIILASIIGIEQLGVDGTVLTLIIAIVFGSALGAAALAFGLGAKNIVANMLAVQQLSKNYSIGDTVRLGESEGRILDITQTAVLLEGDNGRLLIPGKRFSEEISTRVDPQN